jgi:hypothetical protein
MLLDNNMVSRIRHIVRRVQPEPFWRTTGNGTTVFWKRQRCESVRSSGNCSRLKTFMTQI